MDFDAFQELTGEYLFPVPKEDTLAYTVHDMSAVVGRLHQYFNGLIEGKEPNLDAALSMMGRILVDVASFCREYRIDLNNVARLGLEDLRALPFEQMPEPKGPDIAWAYPTIKNPKGTRRIKP